MDHNVSSDFLHPADPDLYAFPYIPGICYTSQLHLCVRHPLSIKPLTRIYHVVSVFAIKMAQMMAMQPFFLSLKYLFLRNRHIFIAIFSQ